MKITSMIMMAVLGMAGSASAIFLEDFNAMTGTIVGTQNGWHSGNSAGGNGIGFIGGGLGSAPLPSMNLSGILPTGGPFESQAVNGDHNLGFGIAIARDITADKLGDGSFDVVLDTFVPDGGGIRVAIGSADSILRSNVATEQHWLSYRQCPSTVIGCESGTVGVFALASFIAASDPDGAGTGDPGFGVPPAGGPHLTDSSIDATTDWIQLRLQTDASGFLTVSHRLLGTTPWLGSFTSAIGLTNGSADVQALQIGALSGRIDNVVFFGGSGFRWNTNNGGDWNSLRNWAPFGIPDGNTSTAQFAAAISAPHTVFNNSDVTVKKITFGDANAGTIQQSYGIAGQGIVTLEADTGNANITVLEGIHQFQTVVTLSSTTDVDASSGTTLTFNNILNLGVNDLNLIGLGEVVINNDLNTGGGSINASAGTISGSGTVSGDLNNSGATVAPGNSAGMLTVAGDYTQTAGSLAIEIDGSAAGEFDVLKVIGNLDISDGSLDVAFNALPGTFGILDVTGSSTGAFASVNNTGGLDVSFDTSQLFSTGELTVFSAVLGDMDGSLTVTTADVALFVQALVNRDAYNLNGFFVNADFNGDVDSSGTFDLGDLSAFSSLTFSASASAVPEPTSASLLIVSLSALALVGRRRK